MGTKQPDQSCPDSDAEICHCCHLLILFIQDGTFSCEKKACPAVTCLNPAAGECCPECNNCQLDGRLYQNGQRFPDPTDLCQQCACEVSVAVSCSRQIFFSSHIQLSSVQYGMYALRKAHMCSTPSLRGFPSNGPFTSFQGRLSNTLSFYACLLQALWCFFEKQLTM